jgi:hypothetical protein
VYWNHLQLSSNYMTSNCPPPPSSPVQSTAYSQQQWPTPCGGGSGPGVASVGGKKQTIFWREGGVVGIFRPALTSHRTQGDLSPIVLSCTGHHCRNTRSTRCARATLVSASSPRHTAHTRCSCTPLPPPRYVQPNTVCVWGHSVPSLTQPSCCPPTLTPPHSDSAADKPGPETH